MRFSLHWSEAKIAAVRDLTPSIRLFEIAPAAGLAEPWRPGAHINVGVIVGGRPDTRSYSLVGRPEAGPLSHRRAPRSGRSRRLGLHARAEAGSGAEDFQPAEPVRDRLAGAGGAADRRRHRHHAHPRHGRGDWRTRYAHAARLLRQAPRRHGLCRGAGRAPRRSPVAPCLRGGEPDRLGRGDRRAGPRGRLLRLRADAHAGRGARRLGPGRTIGDAALLRDLRVERSFRRRAVRGAGAAPRRQGHRRCRRNRSCRRSVVPGSRCCPTANAANAACARST